MLLSGIMLHGCHLQLVLVLVLKRYVDGALMLHQVGGLKVVRACAHLPIVRVADTNDVIPMLPTAKFRQGHSRKR